MEQKTLYFKKGRRYYPWGNLQDYHRMGTDLMPAGTFRLVYCPEDGVTRFTTDVTPANAPVLAAMEKARWEMEQAILERARATPYMSEKYTQEQQELIQKFRNDMAALGALVPMYWTNSTAWEIVEAGINAVKQVL